MRCVWVSNSLEFRGGDENVLPPAFNKLHNSLPLIGLMKGTEKQKSFFLGDRKKILQGLIEEENNLTEFYRIEFTHL